MFRQLYCHQHDKELQYTQSRRLHLCDVFIDLNAYNSTQFIVMQFVFEA
jgi:hypothetical protein